MVKKSTHTIQDVEGLMYEIVEKINNAETKTERHALIKKLKSLEKHYNDCNDKHINGKKYPERMYHSDTKPMNKEEIFSLIDSIDHPRSKEFNKSRMHRGLDLSGVLTHVAKDEMSNLRS